MDAYYRFALFQLNFLETNELNEDLPEIINPDIVTLSDENVVFNLIEDVQLDSEPLIEDVPERILTYSEPQTQSYDIRINDFRKIFIELICLQKI
jgi:hypothetical protein